MLFCDQKELNVKQLINALVITTVTTTMGWYAGRNYEQFVSHQEFTTQLTSQPIGPETVGFKPLQELPLLKEIKFVVEGQERRFVVGEIKKFESSRYGTKSELVLDWNNTAVAEIIRAGGMNAPAVFTTPDDCYRSRTCRKMNPLAVWTSNYVGLADIKRRIANGSW